MNRWRIESYTLNLPKPKNNEKVIIVYEDGEFEKAIYKENTGEFLDPITKLTYSHPDWWIRIKQE